MLERVDQNFKKRMDQCKGRHLSDVIFKITWNKNLRCVQHDKKRIKSIFKKKNIFNQVCNNVISYM